MVPLRSAKIVRNSPNASQEPPIIDSGTCHVVLKVGGVHDQPGWLLQPIWPRMWGPCDENRLIEKTRTVMTRRKVRKKKENHGKTLAMTIECRRHVKTNTVTTGTLLLLSSSWCRGVGFCCQTYSPSNSRLLLRQNETLKYPKHYYLECCHQERIKKTEWNQRTTIKAKTEP